MIEKIVQIWDRYWMLFMQGLGVTLLLSLVIVIVGTLLGFLLAMLRLSNWKIVKIRPLNTLAGIYVEIVRGTPMLLQLYFFYFMLPMAFPSMNLSPIVCCAVALCLNSAAYVSEVIRSGIQAVDKGQMEAARSLGLNHRQAMVKVILPQAIKNIMPALGNEFVMMIDQGHIPGFHLLCGRTDDGMADRERCTLPFPGAADYRGLHLLYCDFQPEQGNQFHGEENEGK